jgi:hypothetical protein
VLPLPGPSNRREGGADRRGLTAIDGANALIAVFVVVQMWLLSAALEAVLAGRLQTAFPAAIASGALFAGCGLLFRFVQRLDHQMRGR